MLIATVYRGRWLISFIDRDKDFFYQATLDDCVGPPHAFDYGDLGISGAVLDQTRDALYFELSLG